MAIGSGLGSHIGIAPETVYGTFVAPTKFLEGTAKLSRKQQIYQGAGMAGGQTVQRGSRRAVASQTASGTLEVGVQSRGMGHLINGLFGGTVTPTLETGATTAYKQTHALADGAGGDPYGKHYSIQAGVPQLDGTLIPYNFVGSQITSAEFSCETGGGLMASFNIEARQADETGALAAPSYPAVNDFHFAQATVKVGTYGAEAAVSGVRSLSLSIERSRHDGGPYMGSQGLRSQGIINDWTTISGTIQADFLDKATFADRFAAGTSTSLVWEFVGPEIEAGHNETIRFTVPMIFFEGDTPQAEGPDVVSTSFNFTGLFDGTNDPITIEYINDEIAL